MPPTLTAEQEAERQRELARIRQQNKRDRDNAEKNGTNGTTPPTFNLRNLAGTAKPESAPVKLFTKKEAEESQEKLIFVYQQGAKLLDEVLEIVVKDHEEVAIWALDDSEAAIIVGMHLERAQVDPAAARAARMLIDLYNRWYIAMLFGPKLGATTKHVIKHKGFSFR